VDSEVLSPPKSEATTPRKSTTGVRVVRQISSFHASVLPDPETLYAYSKLIPNGPDRIMGLIEREAAHRHRRITRGHWMAFTLTLGLAGSGVYMGVTGHEWLAGALFTTTIGAVLTAFILGKRERTRVGSK